MCIKFDFFYTSPNRMLGMEKKHYSLPRRKMKKMKKPRLMMR